MVNPALGEGIFHAMYAGLLLGEHLAPALSGRGDIRAALAAYERAFTRNMASSYRNSWLLTRVMSNQAVLGSFIGRFSKNTDFCYDFTEMVMGVMPPRRAVSIPGLVARALLPRLFYGSPQAAAR